MVTFTLTAADVRRSARLWALRGSSFRWWTPVVGVVVALASVRVNRWTPTAIAVLIGWAALFTVAYLAIAILGMQWRETRRFKTLWWAGLPRTLSWDEEGYWIESQQGRTAMPWSAVRGMLDDSAQLLFLVSSHDYALVPKRALSDEQLEVLRTLAPARH